MYNAQLTISRVQSELKAKKITQKKLLSDCGMSENTLKKMSDNNGMASFSLAKIADYLDCSVDYLLGRTDNSQSHKEGNYVAINGVSGNSNSFIGNGASGDVTVNNAVPQNSQETTLIKIFEMLDDVKRSKILTYADNLNNDIDILYADHLMPYKYVSNKALLAAKTAIREVDNYLNEIKIYNPVLVILSRCREDLSYTFDFSDEEKKFNESADADYNICIKLNNLINAFNDHVYKPNHPTVDTYSNVIKCRNDLAELVGIYKR